MGAGNIADFVSAFLSELNRTGPTKVAVIYGGDSAEREVSLHSGACVLDALKRKGYDARLVDMSNLLLSEGDLTPFVGEGRPDVAFLAVHGTHAEDGAIQGLFELLHIPYTGSRIEASAIGMDKALTKTVLEQAGLRVPKGVRVSSADAPISLSVPLIVKPNAQGSTVGLTFVDKQEDLEQAIRKALQYDDSVLIEEWIQGMETSVPVLGDRALIPVEIAPKSGRYDFASKYEEGATEEIIPARLPEATLKKLQEIALKAHRALGCEGATRTDIFVRGEELIALEVNTLPGMTRTSLLPNSAIVDGMPYDDLVEWVVEDALKRYAKKT
jgi:D-alanine--D-alanine ligase